MNQDGVHHILFVDDDKLIRWFVERALGRAGYRVDCVSSVAAAMAFLGAQCPDLIITDLRMPYQGGLEFLKTLQGHAGCFPVLVCSAFVSAELRERLENDGVYGILEKPFRTSELLEAVEEAIGDVASRGRGDSGACRVEERRRDPGAGPVFPA